MGTWSCSSWDGLCSSRVLQEHLQGLFLVGAGSGRGEGAGGAPGQRGEVWEGLVAAELARGGSRCPAEAGREQDPPGRGSSPWSAQAGSSCSRARGAGPGRALTLGWAELGEECPPRAGTDWAYWGHLSHLSGLSFGETRTPPPKKKQLKDGKTRGMLQLLAGASGVGCARMSQGGVELVAVRAPRCARGGFSPKLGHEFKLKFILLFFLCPQVTFPLEPPS